MATFTTFNNLPFEIRAYIWEYTVEPRTVEVRVLWKDFVPRLVSTTPVPAPLQACREARNIGLYKQALSEVGTADRYVWLNLDIDMVSIGTVHFQVFELVAPTIRRLKFERENQDACWWYNESNLIRNFVNAEEIHVICADGFKKWGGTTEEYNWPCAVENIVFFDLDEGLEMRGREFEEWYQEWYEGEISPVLEMDEEEANKLLAELATRGHFASYGDNFVNAEEIHVICADGFKKWGGTTVEYNWPCAVENIVFCDVDEGLEMRGREFEEWYQEWYEGEISRVLEMDEEEASELFAELTTLGHLATYGDVRRRTIEGVGAA